MHTLARTHFLDRFHMSDSQIYYMDVISHTGSVRSIIVVSEYAETFQLADCNLCNVRNQVVRNPFRIFSDQTGFVCADRIKVSQKHDIPFRIPDMKIGQDLLQHALCLSVRIGDLAFRTILGDRNLRRISVYRCGRTEDHVLTAMLAHHIAEDQRTCNIVVIIFPRFCNRLSNRFESRKIDDRLDLFFLKNRFQILSVQKISFIKFQCFSCDLLYPLQCYLTGIVEIVYYNNLKSSVQQFHTSMTSDIACSASY